MSSLRDLWASKLPRWAVVAHDLVMVWLCWVGLHQFRYSLVPDAPALPLWSTEMAIVLVAQGLVFWQVGLYRGLWRFASVPDLWNIVKACVLGLVLISLALVMYNRLELVSRVVLLLYPFVLTGLLGMPRLLYRAWKDGRRGDRENAVRVLIVGAGQAGETLVRDMRRTGAYQPVGFLDDARRLRGSKVQGIPVLGRIAEAAEIARETAAKLLVIAIPSADATELQRIVQACERTGLPFRMVPKLRDVLEGRSLPGQLKKVAIEDLLGRKPVLPDWKAIREWLGGRSVLVTGAGGSIGAELCRQVAAFDCEHLTLLDSSETSLFEIEREMRETFPHVPVTAVLCDVRQAARTTAAFRKAKPDLVFHAAALKHVSMVERHPREGVLTNVIGTWNVAEASKAANAGQMVLISTDKAVDPTNVMGATKRLAEAVIQAQQTINDNATRFSAVRFGNVLGSSGSVVPIFKAQIERGGPVTVTHPDITRFFMTIPEAAQLVLHATATCHEDARRDARLFLLEMGEPVRILDLARQMIALSGRTPGKDIDIEITGLRPGEKLNEALLDETERSLPAAPKVLEVVTNSAVRVTADHLSTLARLADEGDEEALREALFNLVAQVRGEKPGATPNLRVISGSGSAA
jgi:FlaA1/EpsC-like NDP-sugar epimerase